MSREIAKKTALPKDESAPDNALVVWLRLQRSLADKNGVSLVTLSQDGAAIGRIENDNSICKALRVAPDYAPLCQADCGGAHDRALTGGERIEYTCHAGLHCFAMPVSIGKRQLVILGGRAFTSTAEYMRFQRNYNDLPAVRSGECLKNIKFLDARDLAQTAELVDSTATYHFHTALPAEPVTSGNPNTSPELLDAHLEIIRLTDQLETRKRAIAQFYEFLRGIAATLDSDKVYQTVLIKFSEMLKAERSSLMILNEESNELALEAALGAHHAPSSTPVRVKLGEGVAGSVLASGLPLVVRDVETDARLPLARPGQYQSKSFICFPITLGARKVGVINLTERRDGLPYDNEDLTFLELMSPHLALIIDRTEWHKKAETYQQMSLTDPLTGLPNRRYLSDRLFEEVERSKRYDTPLSFMIIDVDHFKSYNDIYGHTNADIVLVKTAQLLRNSIRAIDMSARFAGDEFCIVLPETEIDAAVRIAERLGRAVSENEFRAENGGHMGHVTLSIGVASFCPTRQSPLAIIEAADRALYQAKMRGRNCVAAADAAA
ncbi:MAG: diguanylate cyclase [Blastocatellia bacterium]